MSRIDSALQRAMARDASSADAQADVFVSAWDGQGPRNIRAVANEAAASPSPGVLSTVTGSELPTLNTRWKERIASSSDCDALLVEQFRRLAATLHNAQTASGIRTVLVSSASPGEGKTLTAINLSLVLSQSYGKRVLLIDADLRRPSINQVVEVTGSVGLSAALKAKSDQKLGVVELSPTLTILPAGPADPDPLSGLTSLRMKQILEEASSRFDWVILDGPPIGGLADAALLAQMVEGTLLVIKAGSTNHAAAEKAIASIGRDRILGVVLNDANVDDLSAYAPYYGQERKPN